MDSNTRREGRQEQNKKRPYIQLRRRFLTSGFWGGKGPLRLPQLRINQPRILKIKSKGPPGEVHKLSGFLRERGEKSGSRTEPRSARELSPGAPGQPPGSPGLGPRATRLPPAPTRPANLKNNENSPTESEIADFENPNGPSPPQSRWEGSRGQVWLENNRKSHTPGLQTAYWDEPRHLRTLGPLGHLAKCLANGVQVGYNLGV